MLLFGGQNTKIYTNMMCDLCLLRGDQFLRGAGTAASQEGMIVYMAKKMVFVKHSS